MTSETLLQNMPGTIRGWRSSRRLKAGDTFSTQFAMWRVVRVCRRARTTGAYRLRHAGSYDIERIRQ